MAGQIIKTFYPPKRHAERVALNKKLREEQQPSTKNTILKVGRRVSRVVGKVHQVVSKKLQNFIEDEKKSNAKLSRVIQDVDKGFKNLGPTSNARWLKEGDYHSVYPGSRSLPEEPESRKKKKKKKKKNR